jgi:signal transduction histidine kinase
VRVLVATEADEAVLRVQDDGPGLTSVDRQRAFEPYYRGVGGGAGLGLTIAREIITTHQGRIWLRDRAAGGAEAGFSLALSSPAR